MRELKAAYVIVDQMDGSSETYYVTKYEWSDGVLVLTLADEDTGDAVSVKSYAPGTVRLTTVWYNVGGGPRAEFSVRA